MSNECPRAGRWFGGCRFRPRYDKRPANTIDIDGYSGTASAVLEMHRMTLEHMQVVTYVRDVCERCGKTIERKP